jgi:hypothetical protein
MAVSSVGLPEARESSMSPFIRATPLVIASNSMESFHLMLISFNLSIQRKTNTIPIGFRPFRQSVYACDTFPSVL